MEPLKVYEEVNSIENVDIQDFCKSNKEKIFKDTADIEKLCDNFANKMKVKTLLSSKNFVFRNIKFNCSMLRAKIEFY